MAPFVQVSYGIMQCELLITHPVLIEDTQYLCFLSSHQRDEFCTGSTDEDRDVKRRMRQMEYGEKRNAFRTRSTSSMSTWRHQVCVLPWNIEHFPEY